MSIEQTTEPAPARLRMAPDPAQRLSRAQRRLARQVAAVEPSTVVRGRFPLEAGQRLQALRDDVEQRRHELEMSRFAKVYGPRKLLPATIARIEAAASRFARSSCDCDSAPIPGVFYDPATGDVQRCDRCRLFPGDLEAAAALAARYGATVRFRADGDDPDDIVGDRTYNAADGFDGMIADGTNPWIEPRVVYDGRAWTAVVPALGDLAADVPDFAGLCVTCRSAIMLYARDGRLAWRHLDLPDDAATHDPAPAPGSVALADRWDHDDAAAGRLHTFQDEAVSRG